MKESFGSFKEEALSRQKRTEQDVYEKLSDIANKYHKSLLAAEGREKRLIQDNEALKRKVEQVREIFEGRVRAESKKERRKEGKPSRGIKPSCGNEGSGTGRERGSGVEQEEHREVRRTISPPKAQLTAVLKDEGEEKKMTRRKRKLKP